MFPFTNVCKYKEKCEAFSMGDTCNHSIDKDYCGIYRQFRAGKIKVWVRGN